MGHDYNNFIGNNLLHMEKSYSNCKPTICWKDLLSNDWIFMTNEVVKTNCKCFCKSVCIDILRLLKDDHRPEAMELLSHTRPYNGAQL